MGLENRLEFKFQEERCTAVGVPVAFSTACTVIKNKVVYFLSRLNCSWLTLYYWLQTGVLNIYNFYTFETYFIMCQTSSAVTFFDQM